MHYRCVGVRRADLIECEPDRRIVTDDTRKADRACYFIYIDDADPFIGIARTDLAPRQRLGGHQRFGGNHSTILPRTVAVSTFWCARAPTPALQVEVGGRSWPCTREPASAVR